MASNGSCVTSISGNFDASPVCAGARGPLSWPMAGWSQWSSAFHRSALTHLLSSASVQPHTTHQNPAPFLLHSSSSLVKSFFLLSILILYLCQQELFLIGNEPICSSEVWPQLPGLLWKSLLVLSSPCWLRLPFWTWLLRVLPALASLTLWVGHWHSNQWPYLLLQEVCPLLSLTLVSIDKNSTPHKEMDAESWRGSGKGIGMWMIWTCWGAHWKGQACGTHSVDGEYEFHSRCQVEGASGGWGKPRQLGSGSVAERSKEECRMEAGC